MHMKDFSNRLDWKLFRRSVYGTILMALVATAINLIGDMIGWGQIVSYYLVLFLTLLLFLWPCVDYGRNNYRIDNGYLFITEYMYCVRYLDISIPVASIDNVYRSWSWLYRRNTIHIVVDTSVIRLNAISHDIELLKTLQQICNHSNS